MPFPFELMVAGRYLRARKAEGFVSVIAGFSFAGIMLGVATLIIVMAVMNGFREELLGRILGLNGPINVYASSGPLYAYDDLALEIQRVDGVTVVIPSIEGQALISVDGQASGTIIRGLSPEDFARKPVLADSLIAGHAQDFRGTNVAIGTAMAKRLRLRPGDTLTLIAPKGKPGPFGTIPRSRAYTVGAIFEAGMYEYDNGFVFMPLPAAQKFFRLPGAVTALEVMTTNPANPDDVRTNLEIMLKGRASVHDWRDVNSSFFAALQVERNVMFLILSLIILVAAFNIISSMIMLVKDKTRDIAIMRTMGAERASMLRIFMMAGASIGLAGTLAGAILGISFAENIETIRQFIEGFTGWTVWEAEIRFLSEIPAVINWGEVMTVLGMAFTLSVLATLYPAWRAARLDPVEALRYE